MTSRLINSQTYVFPPKSDQKPGDIPLGECINNTTTPTIFGPGCWQLLFLSEPAHDEVESAPDSLDSRMQQTWYTNGMLWGSSGTTGWVDGELKAGIAWFAVAPKINGAGKVEGQVKKQGYLALANNNLSMPAIAMGSNGKGAIAFAVMGEDYYPSAGYVTIDANGSVGPVHIAAAGLGPDDGFTSYKAFVGDPPRTRWGDYGAAVTDGSDIWIASEYIGQTCTYARQVATDFSVLVQYNHSKGVHVTRFIEANDTAFGCPWGTGIGPGGTNGIACGSSGGGGLTVVDSSAKSLYNGVTVGLTKRWSHNFQFQVNYTMSWDKSDDDNERDPFTYRYISYDNLAAEYGYSDRDQRHRLNGFLLWEAPGKLNVNLRYSYRSAQPLSLAANGEISQQ